MLGTDIYSITRTLFTCSRQSAFPFQINYLSWPLQMKVTAAMMPMINNAPLKLGKRIFRMTSVSLLLFFLTGLVITSLFPTLGGNVTFTVVKFPSIAPPDTLSSFTNISIFWLLSGMKGNPRWIEEFH